MLECKTVIVKFINGRDGKEEIRLAVVIPNGDVCLFPSRAFETSQKWLRDGINRRLDPRNAQGSGTSEKEFKEDPSQV